MPYSNVPKADWPKMEKCVKDVMAQGHDKSSAVAICHTSIVKHEAVPLYRGGRVVEGRIIEQVRDVDVSNEDVWKKLSELSTAFTNLRRVVKVSSDLADKAGVERSLSQAYTKLQDFISALPSKDEVRQKSG